MINLPGKPSAPRRKRARNTRSRTSAKGTRDQLLNVKIRAKTEGRKRRRRLLGLFVKTTFLMVFFAGLYIGGKLVVERLFFSNPEYTLEKIEVSVAGRLSREAVLHIAQVRTGENIFNLDLEAIHARLAAVPQIETVDVQREIPDQLMISITERRPVAWITKSTQPSEVHTMENAILIDGHSVALRTSDPDPEHFRLPIISGFDVTPVQSGEKISAEVVQAALKLIATVDRVYADTRLRIREIDVSRGYGLIVTDQNQVRILMPMEDLDYQIRRLDALYTQFLSGQYPAFINLMIEKNIPVTFKTEDGSFALRGDGGAEALQEVPKAGPSPTPVRKASPANSNAATNRNATPPRPVTRPQTSSSQRAAAAKPAATPVPVRRAMPVE